MVVFSTIYFHVRKYKAESTSRGAFTLRSDTLVSATLRTHESNSLKTTTTFTLMLVRTAPCERALSVVFLRRIVRSWHQSQAKVVGLIVVVCGRASIYAQWLFTQLNCAWRSLKSL